MLLPQSVLQRINGVYENVLLVQLLDHFSDLTTLLVYLLLPLYQLSNELGVLKSPPLQ